MITTQHLVYKNKKIFYDIAASITTSLFCLTPAIAWANTSPLWLIITLICLSIICLSLSLQSLIQLTETITITTQYIQLKKWRPLSKTQTITLPWNQITHAQLSWYTTKKFLPTASPDHGRFTLKLNSTPNNTKSRITIHSHLNQFASIIDIINQPQYREKLSINPTSSYNLDNFHLMDHPSR